MGKFLALIKKWLRGFRINEPGGGGAVAAEPDRLPAGTPGQNSSIKKIALIVGHGHGDSGAVGSGTNEFEYNSWVAEFVKRNLPEKTVEVFYRGASGIVGVAMRAAGFKPDLCVELHLNATKGATGCEVLVLKGDSRSEKIGRSFANYFAGIFDRRLRQDKGIKWITSSDRGYSSLKAQSAIPNKILVEPFFIDTPTEFIAKDDYARFLLGWLRGI